jgi:hypothetical protein
MNDETRIGRFENFRTRRRFTQELFRASIPESITKSEIRMPKNLVPHEKTVRGPCGSWTVESGREFKSVGPPLDGPTVRERVLFCLAPAVLPEQAETRDAQPDSAG